MKRFSAIFEENDSTAQARALGLAYAGGGYWQNPKSGQIEYQTVDGQLQPYKGSGEDNPMAKFGPDAMGGADGGVPQQTALQRLMQRGMQPGQGIGAAPQPGQAQGEGEADEAKAPAGFNQGQGWDPGPDGDTCVNGEEPKPQGIPVDSFVRRGTNDKKWTSGPDGSNLFNTNFAEWMNAGPGEFLPESLTDSSSEPPPRRIGRTLGSNVKPEVRQKDQAKIDLLNQDAKPFLQNPNFDMSMGKQLGSGSFGRVGLSKSDPNVVIKEGEIGPQELKALWTMRNNKNFPSLINAQFDSPFLHQSTAYNNPGDEPVLRGDGGMYFDPEEQDSFDKKYPTAKGRFAMTRMQGRELDDAIYEMDDEQEEETLRKIWRLRRQMHEQGISHNDMHSGNIYVDDDGEVSMLDMGLANADPVSALMEALGGVSMEDYQLSKLARIGMIPDDMRERLYSNVGDVRNMLLDEMDPDETDPDDIEDLMRGGIRHHATDLDRLKIRFPALGNGELVMKLIKALYNGVADKDQMQRMSAAVDRARPDTDTIARANKFRKLRGEPSLSIRNPNIIPPKNLDPDD